MATLTLDILFIEELQDVYNVEFQIMESLPKMISLASLPELKEALSQHLKETQNQITRIEKIFGLLNLPKMGKTCEAMEGILLEAEELLSNKTKNATLDAAIIGAAQKVEHYEIASYGTLLSFAKFLNFDDEIIDLLQEILEEEENADEILTKLAEGTLFTSGVNKEAATATNSQH